MEHKIEYNNILQKIPIPNNIPIFNTKGRLVIVLLEFRIMPEILYVINALLYIYNQDYEIGFSIVYGKTNQDYIEEHFINWENIKLINTGVINHDSISYSRMLMKPQFWENFNNWSHVLIYQTDALLLQKIPDKYFELDYIGAPWKYILQGAGNGGFSLRNIKKMIYVCEKFRDIDEKDIPGTHEDNYFSKQKELKFIEPIRCDDHKRFSVETLYYPEPIGIHCIYERLNVNNKKWNYLINYIKNIFNIK